MKFATSAILLALASISAVVIKDDDTAAVAAALAEGAAEAAADIAAENAEAAEIENEKDPK